MKTDITQAPYHDKFDSKKNYYQLLAQPGRAAQAREITELQSVMRNIIKGVGSAIFKDGDIIEGCAISISNDNHTLTIGDGKVYVQGIVHPVKATTITIQGSGIETVGIKLKESIITYVEDPTLKDPAQGYSNFGQSGADRLKIETEIVANDPEAYTLYTLEEGSLTVNKVSPELTSYTELLARRTYDESENYKVRGLTVTIEPDSTENVKALVSNGKAYVLGYEINKPTTSVIKIPISKDIKSTVNESKGFSESNMKYSLNNKYVKQVKSVYGQVLKTAYVTRQGFLGGTDRLPDTEVYDIVAINQGGMWNNTTKTFTGGTSYSKNVDFTITDGCVDWLPSAEDASRQPALGTTYQVAYKYTKNFIEFKDYSVTFEDGKGYINFGLENGDLPVDESLFLVSYDWYLERIDILVLTKTGDLKIVYGQPNKEGLAIAPETNLEDLPLATLKMPPNSSDVIVINHDNTRVTMKDLNSLLKRVSTLEYNMSVSDLDKEAEAGEQATELKGILTDGFVGFTKADVTNPDFNVAFNLFGEEVSIPTLSSPVMPKIDEENSVYAKFGRISTLPYQEQLGIVQSFATGKMNINPYQVFSDSAQIILSPDTDTWIDEQTVQLPISITTENSVTVPPKFIDDWWTSDSQRELVGNTTETKTSVDNAIKFLEQATTFMRPINVKINGSKFLEGAELKAKFDDIQVDLTPIENCTKGLKDGIIKVGDGGTFIAEFTIPKNITTGTKTLVVYNDSNYAETTFTSQGIQRMFMAAEVSHTNTIKTYQDIIGTNNKLVSSVANEALDLANKNQEQINDLREDLTQVEGRLASVEQHITTIDNNIAELNRELQRQISRIENEIDKVAEETGYSVEYIQSHMNEVASELMAVKQTALEADMKSAIAKSIAEQAQLEAQSATRIANTALAKANAAEIKANMAAINSEKALQTANQAYNSADMAVKKAQNAELIANTSLKEVTSVNQVAQYALEVANKAVTEVNSLNEKAKEHDIQLKDLGSKLSQQQVLINNLASQSADAAAQREQLRNQINSQNQQISSLKQQVTANTNAIASNTSRVQEHEAEINALARYWNLTVSGSSVKRNTPIYLDPLAQSFSFNQDTQVTSIEVAFGDKGTLPITCQIREMSVGGQPTLTTLATKVIYPKEISVSDDSSVLTKITFGTPAYCNANQQYCVVFITEDTQYTLYTADLGEKDLITGQIVNKQPYSVGVLFSSSNNFSWTIHQTKDLKFNMYVMSTQSTGKLVFNQVSNIQANQIVLAVDQVTPANTKINWTFTSDKNDTELPIQAYSTTLLTDVTSKIKLTANMQGISGNTVSPMIVTDTVGIISLLKELSGTYISRLVSLSQPYTSVKQVIDANLPSGTSLQMYFSPDDGQTWIPSIKDDNLTEQVTLYYSRYTYIGQLLKPEPVLNTDNVSISPTGGNLKCATTYFYKFTATNSNGETTGKTFSVTTNGVSGSVSAKVAFDLSRAFTEGITGFKVYRGEASTSLALKYSITGIQSEFVDDGSDTGSSIDTPPTENTATFTSNSFRAKFVLTTNSPLVQPKVKRFMNIIK